MTCCVQKCGNNLPRKGGALSAAVRAVLFGGNVNPSFSWLGQASLIPERNTGSGTPTFTRASTAYQIDFEGKHNLVLSGEARFLGARRVQNLIPAAGSGSASLASGANKTMTLGAGTYVFTMGTEATGSGVATFSGTGGATGTLTASATTRMSVAKTITAGTFIVTASVQALANLQLENTTGQANQNPSEYVSVGVVAAPYFGANVDGVKYFSTLNGNTVSSNIVTEATGAAIVAGASGVAATAPVDAGGPYGYLAEGARADVLGTTAAIRRTMTDVGWVSGGGGITVGTAVGTDGVTDSGASLTAAGANGTILFTTVLGAAVRTYSAWVRRKTGTGTVNITGDNGATWTAITLTTAYQLFQFTTASAANPVVGFRIVTSADAIEVGFNQLEAATFANPTPIPVNVSKAADVLTYPSAGNINGAAGSVYLEITSAWPQSNYAAIISSFTGATGGEPMELINSSGTKLGLYDNAGHRPSSLAFATPYTTVQKVANSWQASGASAFLNGATGVVTGFDGNLDLSANIGIGNHSSGAGAELYGTLRNLRIYPVAPSAAKMQGMTT